MIEWRLSFALMLPHGEPYVASGYTAARPSSPERKILRALHSLPETVGAIYRVIWS